MLRMIYPPKCTFCEKLLSREETDFCHHCRETTEKFTRAKRNIPFVAHWTALWYYKDTVRKSIQRFKFRYRRRYASTFGRLLAMKLSGSLAEDTDILSWIPVSGMRKLQRSYDQSELLCRAVSKELGIPMTRVLKKIRHTPPQSGILNAAQRKANVLGAYKALHPEALAGKRILLLDDVVTTGATASECARVLLTAGAKEVYIAAVAASTHDKK